jgi:hypothetical protein
MRTVSWSAADPDGDALAFDIEVRSEDETDWKLMEAGIEWRTLHTWDTQTMADGLYRLRVTASDRPDNPSESAMTASRESQPFLIDHTPPAVRLSEVSVDDGRLSVRGTARDDASPIAGVEVSVDYGEWYAAFPEDGMFDSPAEEFRLELQDVPAGERSVTVRAFDRPGNPSVAREVTR